MSAGSYSISGDEIFARSRTLATQMGGDPNSSVVIDSRGGLRVLLNNAIRELYRRKAATDSRFRHDINVTNTVAIAGGQGEVPENLMREFLRGADITDGNGFSLITYLDYSTDAQETYNQIGYLWIVTNTFFYRAPAPDLDTYSGDMVIQCPSFPDFPNSMAQDMVLPSFSTADDLVLTLAQALMGEVKLAV